MSALHFDDPSWLQALWLLLPLAALLIRGERCRRASTLAFLAPSRANELLPPIGGARPWLAIGGQLLGGAALIVAAAGPRAGVSVEPARQRGADLIVALDVSKSMLSADVAPNRLERAKSDVRDLADSVVGHRLGLVLFAGRAVVACPLTTDRAFFLGALDRASPASAPRGGTAIGDALRTALTALPAAHDRDQAVVLLTDGEDHDSFPIEAAKQSTERGVRVFTVGLGDPGEGARVPVAGDDGGSTFLKHDGQEVWSKLEENVLTEIATTTGGAYVPARTSAYDLGKLYRDHLAQLAIGDLGTSRRQRHTPRFQWCVAAGLLLLLSSRILGERPKRRGAAPATPALLGTAAALLLSALPASAQEAPRAAQRDAAAAVERGLGQFDGGDAALALAEFETAAALLPAELAIAFDRGCAKLAAGDLDGADGDFARVAAARDSTLAAKARFNRADVAVARARKALGDQPEEATGETRASAVDAIETAIGHLRSCLALAPDHRDARANLEQLRAWLKWIADVWAQRDREQRRKDLDVLQFLDWLFGEEGKVRGAARALGREDDSPLRRAAQEALRLQQKSLEDELPALKEKLANVVQEAAEAASAPSAPGAGTPPAPPSPPPDPAQFEAAMRSLAGAVDAIGASMASTRQALAGGQWTLADQSGHAAQQGLEQLWYALADFGGLVQRGLTGADALVQGCEAFDAAEPQPTLHEQAERNATLAEVLAPHAEAAQGQQELAAACAKAIESAPAIAEQARAAAAALGLSDAATALPAAKEAQRLLKEIADLLPKQDPKDEQQQDQKQDQPPKEQQEQQPQEPKDPSEPKPPTDPKDDGQPSPERKREQAQALLRKALERAKQKHDEQQKAEQAVLIGPGGVDRDW